MFKLAVKHIVAKYLKHRVFNIKEITEADLAPIFREIRIALLNSDVSLDVIKDFFSDIKDELLVKKNYSPSAETDSIVFSAVRRKLIDILGHKSSDFSCPPGRNNKILVVGLNGSGKTTSVAKLAYFLKKNHFLKVKNVSLDIYRPGAYDQLKKLSDSVNIPCCFVENGKFRETIRNQILSFGNEDLDCLIFDNYGLLPNNLDLLEEVSEIKKMINPTEVLFVADAMSSQDLLNTVKIFHEKLNITGIIVSKTDSDAPMGAIFSISYLLKIPIKFMGKGEGISDLVLFYPERIASLILGEGDILSLAEDMQAKSTEESSKKFFMKIMRGHFDLEDLVHQIREVRKLGSIKGIFQMLPINLLEKNFSLDNAEDKLKIWEVLINSMTVKERRNPKLFKKYPNRRVRVINGSGRKPEEFNKLIKRWEDSKKKIDELVSSFRKGRNPLGSFMKS